MWPNGPWGALQVDGSLTLTCTVALFADVLPLLLLQPSEIIVAATSRRTKTEIVLRIANYPPSCFGPLGPFASGGAQPSDIKSLTDVQAFSLPKRACGW